MQKIWPKALRGFTYDLMLPDNTDERQLQNIARGIENFLAVPAFPITRQSKGKTITRDIRPFVEAIILRVDEKKVETTLRHAQSGSVRPIDVIQHILGFPASQAQSIGVIKTSTLLG